MGKIKHLVLYILPISLITWSLISLEWISESVIDGPNLYGLIYPCRSDAIGSSFAYEFYLKGILLNSIVYLLFGVLFYWIVIRAIEKRKIRIGLSIGLWIFVFLIYMPYLIFFSEYTFVWDYSFPVEYKEFKIISIFKN